MDYTHCAQGCEAEKIVAGFPCLFNVARMVGRFSHVKYGVSRRLFGAKRHNASVWRYLIWIIGFPRLPRRSAAKAGQADLP